MTHLDGEDALEIVVGFQEPSPDADTEEGRRFDQALFRAPAAEQDDAAQADARGGLDASLRARLGDRARRRAPPNPSGDHPDGIDPTLGMDLSGSKDGRVCVGC